MNQVLERWGVRGEETSERGDNLRRDGGRNTANG